jgi:hypothetical protein
MTPDPFVLVPRDLFEEAQVAVLVLASTQPDWLPLWRALDLYLNPPTPQPKEEPTP